MSNEGFYNIRIRDACYRTNLRLYNKKYKAIAALAVDDGCNTIEFCQVWLGRYDYMESMSIAELITHETLHHLVREIAGHYVSVDLDRMLQHRNLIDTDRQYIQHNKFSLIGNDEK